MCELSNLLSIFQLIDRLQFNLPQFTLAGYNVETTANEYCALDGENVHLEAIRRDYILSDLFSRLIIALWSPNLRNIHPNMARFCYVQSAHVQNVYLCIVNKYPVAVFLLQGINDRFF